MHVVFLAGGTGSGKSTVARELERLGAWRIDLDELSRAVLEPGTACLGEVADAFGDDLVDRETGALDRALLARRVLLAPSSFSPPRPSPIPSQTLTYAKALGPLLRTRRTLQSIYLHIYESQSSQAGERFRIRQSLREAGRDSRGPGARAGRRTDVR